MRSQLLQTLVTILTFTLCSSLAMAQTTSTDAPPPVQAVDNARAAAGAAGAHDDAVAKEAATITDDEGMSDEDMEMPEEDLDDAPADGQGE